MTECQNIVDRLVTCTASHSCDLPIWFAHSKYCQYHAHALLAWAKHLQLSRSCRESSSMAATQAEQVHAWISDEAHNNNEDLTTAGFHLRCICRSHLILGPPLTYSSLASHYPHLLLAYGGGEDGDVVARRSCHVMEGVCAPADSWRKPAHNEYITNDDISYDPA